MRNRQSSSAGGYPEFYEKQEKLTHQFEARYDTPGKARDQVMIENLIDRGFAWEEAETLVNMREHLYENTEMQQRMAHDCRIQIVRWLYEHRQISDN